MAVYVDNMNAPFGNMIMCHLFADTRAELYKMVDTIGVQRKWIQKIGTKYEHFDVSLGKKKLAIAAGAIEVPYGPVIVEMFNQKAAGLRMVPSKTVEVVKERK